WSYLGYLKVMQPYFNDSKLKSLKSVWKRRFNEQLKGIIKYTDEERSEAALNLINQVCDTLGVIYGVYSCTPREQVTPCVNSRKQKDDNEAGPSSGKCSQNE
ncbi:3273_t:CDS:2, partial [Acaulospora morrowiae]